MQILGAGGRDDGRHAADQQKEEDGEDEGLRVLYHLPGETHAVQLSVTVSVM